MPQVDIITSQNRHRRWTDEEKLSILAAAFAPDAVTAHVAKQANISTGQLYTWRKQLGKAKAAADGGFARVVAVSDMPPVSALPPPIPIMSDVAPAVMPVSAACLPAIEIDVQGNKVRIPATMPPALASAVVRALMGRR